MGYLVPRIALWDNICEALLLRDTRSGQRSLIALPSLHSHGAAGRMSCLLALEPDYVWILIKSRFVGKKGDFFFT